jgi:hypothetical protein
MAGTLHIFRRNDTPLEYQANYNLGPASWVQVFPAAELEDFLRIGSGLPPARVDGLLADLRASGRATEAPVLIRESHLAQMGFAESPSDD